MANVAAPSNFLAARAGNTPPPPPPPPTPHHGKKRAAEHSLEPEQRLSKRFDLLNLVDPNGSRLYIPVPGSSDVQRHTSPSPGAPIATPDPLAFVASPRLKSALKDGSKTSARRARPPPSSSSNDDAMAVEDTPHRVYISDLNAELSDIESDEDTPIFLPDIEKHLSKIPKHVLLGPPPKSTEHNQVVLYNVPSSLSVPEEKDGVRKAIVEARQRIRERQVNLVGEPEGAVGGSGGAGLGRGMGANVNVNVNDAGMIDSEPDAMDID